VLTRTITTIVPRVPGRVEQVGNETVLECSSKSEDMIPSSGKVSSGKEQSTEGNELEVSRAAWAIPSRYR
jgi:hypothetical protein